MKLNEYENSSIEFYIYTPYCRLAEPHSLKLNLCTRSFIQLIIEKKKEILSSLKIICLFLYLGMTTTTIIMMRSALITLKIENHSFPEI